MSWQESLQQSFGFEARKLARILDPAASHAAAARVAEFGNSQHATILRVLRERGPSTVYEIAAYCDLSAHQAGKRVSELQGAGRIRVVMDGFGKELMRATPSGRMARVWFAV